MTRQPRGGTAVLLDAMRAHPRAGELQQHACTALANVLSRSRGASASSSSSSSSFQAQALATAAMRAHAGDSNVQWSACVLLLSLQGHAARSFSPSAQEGLSGSVWLRQCACIPTMWWGGRHLPA
jgi:hypothetical protein